MKFFLILLTILFAQRSFGYANFIGHSYTSCLNCHFNPAGGGPLNDYGRVVSATLISSGAFYSKEKTEEEIAYASGFLFRKPKQNWLRTQINYRGFQMVNNPGSKNSETKKWINMQADARLILKFGENDKFVTVLNYGYAPNQMNAQKKEVEWRSREHYMGYRFTPNFGVYAGLMDKVFGLRVIEHNLSLRKVPQLDVNDQVHGVMLHGVSEKYEGFAHAFVGNLSQSADIRTRGFSSMLERTVFDSHRIGGSVMTTKNDYNDLFSYEVHTKLNLKEGSAILAEVAETKQKTKNGSADRTSRYALVQTSLRPARGFYFLTNIDYFRKDIRKDSYTVTWGPALQYFPIQRLEFRFDMFNTRNFDPTSSKLDSWTYLLQGHIWL